MDKDNNKPTDTSESLDSLETTNTVIDTSAGSTEDGGTVAAPPNPDGSPANGGPAKAPASGLQKVKKFFRRFSLYFLLFCLVVVTAIVIIVVAAISGKTKDDKPITTQTLSDSALKQLANSDATIGDPKQILNVQSNAVFAGKVLIRDSLDVAGALHLGGSLSLPGLTVAGTSNFEQVQINKGLSIGGDSSIQGQLSIQKSLSVAGNATFGGPISAPQVITNSLQLNGDLNLTRHITVGGATPGRSNGNALGSGGSTSVGGSDSAGSININTGSSPAAGCFITVNFSQKFNTTPHVLITPVGSAAGDIAYYVTRSTTNFSVCTTSVPPAGSAFGFDYFILD